MEMIYRYAWSVLFLAIPVLLATRRHFSASIVVCIGFIAVSFLAMEPLVVVFYLAAIPLLLILRYTKARPKVIFAVMAAWAASEIAASVNHDLETYHWFQSHYPLESLSERLSYEPSITDTTEDSPLPIHEAPTQAQIVSVGRSQMEVRRDMLRELNSQTFSEFAATNGFGALRMQSFRRSYLRLDPPPPSKPFPKRPEVIEPPTAIQNPQAVDQGTPPLPIHTQVAAEFTKSIEWAYLPSRQMARGFVPHCLASEPGLRGNSPNDWQISRLDLVSLLKFAEPRVYLSEHLPRMEELRNAETRPVDEFERQALEQLRGGEDIVVDQQLNTIRMVGAVRAARQCLDCHSVRRGDLLGAFSYLLDRKQPLPPPKVDGRPVSLRMPL